MKNNVTKNIVINSIKKNVHFIIILVIILYFVSYLKLVNSLLISRIIDYVIPEKDLHELKHVIMLMLFYSFSLLLLDLLKTIISSNIGNIITGLVTFFNTNFI